MDIDHALQVHTEWKIKLRKAMHDHAHLEAATIANDHVCELGVWLHGDAKRAFASRAEYQACVTRHAAFHTEAAKVASLINTARYQDAESMLAGSFASASTQVGAAIIALKKVANL